MFAVPTSTGTRKCINKKIHHILCLCCVWKCKTFLILPLPHHGMRKRNKPVTDERLHYLLCVGGWDFSYTVETKRMRSSCVTLLLNLCVWIMYCTPCPSEPVSACMFPWYYQTFVAIATPFLYGTVWLSGFTVKAQWMETTLVYISPHIQCVTGVSNLVSLDWKTITLTTMSELTKVRMPPHLLFHDFSLSDELKKTKTDLNLICMMWPKKTCSLWAFSMGTILSQLGVGTLSSWSSCPPSDEKSHIMIN